MLLSLVLVPSPTCPLFPYTTLFRSERANRRFADRAAVFMEAHVVRLQSDIPSLEHHERPAYVNRAQLLRDHADTLDRKSTRLNSSHVAISYAVFCLKKKKQHKQQTQ